MHGQYDWTRDPNLSAKCFDWDTACAGRPVASLAQLPAPHLHQHPGQGPRHRLRRAAHERGPAVEPVVSSPTRSSPRCSTLNFDLGVMLHDVEVDQIRSGKKTWAERGRSLRDGLRKTGKLTAKDYVDLAAAHRPDVPHDARRQLRRQRDAQRVVVHDHLLRTLPRGHARVHDRGVRTRRVARGTGTSVRCSARPTSTGGKLFHILSGNLSHQIEHHLFPDLPARRYAEMAPKVQEVCERYGLPYNSGSLVTSSAVSSRRSCASPRRGLGATTTGRRRRRPRRSRRPSPSPPRSTRPRRSFARCGGRG